MEEENVEGRVKKNCKHKIPKLKKMKKKKCKLNFKIYMLKGKYKIDII
jgi:hypothetical protein